MFLLFIVLLQYNNLLNKLKIIEVSIMYMILKWAIRHE